LAETTRITDSDLASAVPLFPTVNQLTLANNLCGDKTAVSMANLTNLSRLDMSGTRLTDAGLEKLSRLNKLRELDVRRSRVTPTAAEAFKQAHPNCGVLW
jgi:hypothetical protein